MKTQVTQEELATAILLSEFNQKSHVNFIPFGKEYLTTLNLFKRKKYCKPLSNGSKFIVLTEKGRRKFSSEKLEDKLKFMTQYEEIDKFIDDL